MEEPNNETATEPTEETPTPQQLIVDKIYNELQNGFLQQPEFWLENNSIEALRRLVNTPAVHCVFFCVKMEIPKDFYPTERSSDAIVGFYNPANEAKHFSYSIFAIQHDFVIEPKSVFYPFEGKYPLVVLKFSFSLLNIKAYGDEDDNKKEELYLIHCFIQNSEERKRMSEDHTFFYSNKKVVMRNGSINEEELYEINDYVLK